MSLVSFAAIYFVLWWTVLFAVLPLGVRSAHEAGDAVADGHDAGAPVAPQLLRKVVLTTIVSGIIFGAVLMAIKSGLINVEALLGYLPDGT